MRVREVMSTGVEFIDPNATVMDAAVLMGEIDVGGLPVGTPEKLHGILTDRDILYRVVARGLDPSIVTLNEILSRPAIACKADDSLQAAMDLMASNHIRRLAVEDEAGRTVGWLTLGDLSRHLLVNSASLQQSLAEMTGETAEPGAGAAHVPN